MQLNELYSIPKNQGGGTPLPLTLTVKRAFKIEAFHWVTSLAFNIVRIQHFTFRHIFPSTLFPSMLFLSTNLRHTNQSIRTLLKTPSVVPVTTFPLFELSKYFLNILLVDESITFCSIDRP